jgi:radical SAM-linked protein
LEPLSTALMALSGEAPSFACVPTDDLAHELQRRGLPAFSHDSWTSLTAYPLWIVHLEDPAQLLGLCRLFELCEIPAKATERSAEMPQLFITGPAAQGLVLARVFADRVLPDDPSAVAAAAIELLRAVERRAIVDSIPGLPPLDVEFSLASGGLEPVEAQRREKRVAILQPVHTPRLRAGACVGWEPDAAGRPRRVVEPWGATVELREGMGLDPLGEEIWSAVEALEGDEDMTLLARFAVGAESETEADREAILEWVREALRRSRLEPGRLTVQLLPVIGDSPGPEGPQALADSLEKIHTRLRKMRCRVETGDPIASWRGGLLRSLGADAAPLLLEMLRRGARAAESPLACEADLWHKALQAVHLDGRSPDRSASSPLRAAGSSCPESSVRATQVPTDQRRGSAISAEAGASANPAVRGDSGSGESSPRPEPRADRWRRWADLAPRHFDYRIEFSKRGRWRHLSQRELAELFLDICRRAELPLATTGVAQRKARISFGPSLQVGVEGLREYIDLSLTRKYPRLESVMRPWLPEGLTLMSVQFRPAGSARMGLGEIARAKYEALIPLSGETGLSMQALQQRRDEVERTARRARLALAAGSETSPDAIHQLVRIEVAEPCAEDSSARVSFTLDLDCEGKKLRALELIDRLLDGLIEEPHLLPIRRTRLLAASPDGNDWITPSEQIERHRRELRARAKRCA